VWSANDRWLLAWGLEPDDEVVTRLRVVMYDVPSFDLNTTSSITKFIHDVTVHVWSVVFLPGDEILAMSCANSTGVNVLMFLDLHDGSVIKETPQGTESLYSLAMDGDDLVAVADDAGILTFSAPDWGATASGHHLEGRLQTFDVHNASGWVFTDDEYNLTMFGGEPRELTFRGDSGIRPLFGASWTRTREGDLVIAVHRTLGEGTNLQLWQTMDRPGLPGMRMLGQVNSSKWFVQMEADPAFPGLMAVSFHDGTFALYHMNVTPYPPPPEEISGLDIGPIDEPPNGNGDDRNDTDGGDDSWGSKWSDIFPLVLVIVLVAMVAVYVVLRLRSPEDGSGDG
jgi:hypothetical protein